MDLKEYGKSGTELRRKCSSSRNSNLVVSWELEVGKPMQCERTSDRLPGEATLSARARRRPIPTTRKERGMEVSNKRREWLGVGQQ